MKTQSTQGVTGLAREAAMDFGRLVGQHVKIAQLELSAEMHALGRRACLIAGLATLVVLGYALAIVGLALILAARSTVGMPFAIVGLVHMVGAGGGLIFVLLSARKSHLMDNTTDAMNRGLAVLEEATSRTDQAAVQSADQPPIKGSHVR